MSLHFELTPFFEYLYQIRKAEDFLLIEFLFPNTWKIPKKYLIEDKFINNGQMEDKVQLSFVSEFTKEELELVTTNIKGIIHFNLEREEKQRLLDFKINELKSIFEKENQDTFNGMYQFWSQKKI